MSAGYGSNYSSTRPDDLIAQFENRWSASVSLGVSLPLFDRLATRRSVARATIAEENARIAASLTRQEVALEVQRALLDRTAAREQFDAAKAQVRAAEAALDAVEKRYQVGAATLQEVTLARADLVTARSSQVTSRYDLLWQDRLIDYHTGALHSWLQSAIMPAPR